MPIPALPELPDAILVSILQQISLKHRLSRCALVSRAWAAAVAATTAHLDVSLSPSNVQAVQAWIHRQAGHLAAINVQGDFWFDRPTIELQCSGLTQLEQLVVSSTVNLALHTAQPTVSTRSSRSSSRPSSGSSTSTLLLPRLRSVCLMGCMLPLQHLKQLSKLTALTSLQLEPGAVFVTPYSSRLATEDAVQSALSALLSQLSQLRRLTLAVNTPTTWQRGEHPALQHVSSMQGLQWLQVMQRCPDLDHLLPHLPSSLTALVLSDTVAAPAAGELQAATRLTGLRHLDLRFAELDPCLLCSWTKLQHLHLVDVLLTPAGDGDGDAPAAAAAAAAAAGGEDDGDAAAAAAAAAAAGVEDGVELRLFLQALQNLTQLQHLQLVDISLEAGPQAVLQQQRFAAVVASPQLTSLELAVSYGMPLPVVGLRQLFAPGVRLQALRVLRLRGRTPDPWIEPRMVADDLVGMAAACPGLQELVLEDVAAPGAQCEQLLSALGLDLQTLSMHNCRLDDAAVAVLPSLCGLRSLTFVNCQIQRSGMLQLTALSRLTHIKLVGTFPGKPSGRLRQRRRSNVYSWDLHANDPQAEQPDVSRRLANLLDTAGVC